MLHVVVGNGNVIAYLTGVGNSESETVKNPLDIRAAVTFHFVDGRLCPA